MSMRRSIVAAAVVGFGSVVTAIALGAASAARPQSSPPVSPEASAGDTWATYEIDPVHSTAIFRVHHLGAGRFYGRFNEVTGSFRMDEASNRDVSFDVSIAIASVDTNAEKLDAHLKSPDFFNEPEYPKMTFVSKSATRKGKQEFEVAGDLTIHGVTRPQTLIIEWTGTAEKSPRSGRRCGWETTFTINRSDFGMGRGVDEGTLGDETKIIVSLEGMKK